MSPNAAAPVPLPSDELWPRASEWLAAGTARWAADAALTPDLGILGIPAHLTSLSPTSAHTTPAAVRAALARYSTWAQTVSVDLGDLLAVDLGDVVDPDGDEGEARTIAAGQRWPGELLVGVGGDNSITYPLALGMEATGVVTVDAHHDLRDGRSNGSPIQRLLAAGAVPGERIVQIGLSDFANSPAYAHRAAQAGITLVTRDAVAERGMATVMAAALDIAGAGAHPRVHVDLDVDACDRAVVPACPASVPGGLSAHELRLAARLAGADSRVVSMDLCEVDAAADAPDGRTVRLVALCLLEAATGVMLRR